MAMKRHSRSSSRLGITFLELLIAIVILVVVIIAVLQLFDRDVEVRKQQDQAAEMQQNLRAAMDLMSRDIRTASSCASLSSTYLPSGGFTTPISVELPLALIWMPSVGPLSSTAAVADNIRPDGIGIMKCVGNGVVDVVNAPQPTFVPGTQVTLVTGLGLQAGDVGKYLIFWTVEDSTAEEVKAPYYITARIGPAGCNTPGCAFPSGLAPTIGGESVVLGPPLTPTNDPNYATFGSHWNLTNGEVRNFATGSIPSNPDRVWKVGMVEWVEYIVDKWDSNQIPHAYSATTKEGSLEHPLLVRRTNDATEWDVIAHDIENMQLVWLWDPDYDPTTSDVIPGLGLEYQAGDPSILASPGAPAQNTRGVFAISNIVPGIAPNGRIWDTASANPPRTANACAGCPSPAALRKVRLTLLARTRDRDSRISTGGTGFGFPPIEDTPNYFQGSVGIAGGAPTPPLFLSAYKRRALTSELTIRNYVSGAQR